MKQLSLKQCDIIKILEAIRKVRVCILGDVCLDLYWYADMRLSHLSRETPHFPLPIVNEVYSPGGCGNVIQNIQMLQVQNLRAVSVIGEDWRGCLLEKWFAEHQISTEFILKNGNLITPCYCKPIRKGISDVAYEDPRIDFENYDSISEKEENRLLYFLTKASEDSDIIVVSDQFRHGVVTDRIRKRLSVLSKNIPVIVDSRERISLYQDVIIKPNEIEAAYCLGKKPLPENASAEEFAGLAQTLAERNQKSVIVTLGSRGSIWCATPDSEPYYAPAIPCAPPIDIVGAGDTFLSAFSVAYAAGLSGEEAQVFANLASSITVKKCGTTGTASPEEIMKATGQTDDEEQDFV